MIVNIFLTLDGNFLQCKSMYNCINQSQSVFEAETYIVLLCSTFSGAI